MGVSQSFISGAMADSGDVGVHSNQPFARLAADPANPTSAPPVREQPRIDDGAGVEPFSERQSDVVGSMTRAFNADDDDTSDGSDAPGVSQRQMKEHLLG